MLTAVFLHGHLAEKYGSRFDLDVDSVSGAVALLKANFSNFAKDVIGKGNAYRVWVGKTCISQNELQNPSRGQDIHIIPHLAGAGGNSSVFQIIVGIVLVVVGVVLLIFDVPYGIYFIEAGMYLIEGGIIGLIFAAFAGKRRISMSETEKTSTQVSKFFNGAVNTVGQGNPVPILYGRLRVGSQIISGGLSDGDE